MMLHANAPAAGLEGGVAFILSVCPASLGPCDVGSPPTLPFHTALTPKPKHMESIHTCVYPSAPIQLQRSAELTARRLLTEAHAFLKKAAGAGQQV